MDSQMMAAASESAVPVAPTKLSSDEGLTWASIHEMISVGQTETADRDQSNWAIDQQPALINNQRTRYEDDCGWMAICPWSIRSPATHSDAPEN